MNESERFHSLAERLSDDARRLLASPGDRPVVPELFIEHCRRMRRRRALRGVCATAALAAAGVLAAIAAHRSEDSAVAPNQIAVGPAPSVVVTGAGQKPLQAMPVVPPAWQIDGHSEALTLSSVMPRMVLVPFFFADANGDIAQAIAAGWYVPEHFDRVNAHELSPAEIGAATRLLGLERGSTDDDTI